METEMKHELLRSAIDAAKTRDAAGMIRDLFASGVVGSLIWKIGQRFHQKLAPSAIQDCVAEAIADAYAELASGKSIKNLVAYIMTAARNNAVDLVAIEGITQSYDQDKLPDRQDPARAEAMEATRLALRKLALERARALLPRLGQANLQAVMEVVLDSIENDIVDLTDETIGEITHLLPETVCRLKSRGFARLRRLAEAEGYDLSAYPRAIGPSDRANTDTDDWLTTRSSEDE
jgi:DNA-directed RNA polymerase specialized sigma24 family protein